jgi:hypothetical protein
MNAGNTTATNMLRQFAKTAGPEDRAKLQKNIREVTGQVFFGTVLKQMRSEMDPDNPFNGGRAGQMFGTQLDQILISRWAGSTNFKVTDKIAKAWTGTKGKA